MPVITFLNSMGIPIKKVFHSITEKKFLLKNLLKEKVKQPSSSLKILTLLLYNKNLNIIRIKI